MTDGSQTGIIIGSLSAALSTVLGFLGLRLYSKVDELERTLTNQRVNCVTREELKGYMETMRQDRATMHAENQGRLGRIETQVSKSNLLEGAVGRAERDIRELFARSNKGAGS